MTQLEKILAFAQKKLGSSEYHGVCQAFVWNAVAAGIGYHETSMTARDARNKWMKKNTFTDYNPPAGAAVYFNGTGSKGLASGHVALSAGNGYIYDPVDKIKKRRLNKSMNGGYLGWGWEGGVKPEGVNTSIVAGSSSSSSSSVSGGTDIVTDTGTYSSSASSGSAAQSVEISVVTVKSETGSMSAKSNTGIGEIDGSSELFLLIDGDDKIYKPYISGDIKVTRERTGSPGKMTFSCIDIEGMNISEGNAVAFRYKNKKVFFGYIFILERDSDRELVKITCYDQLRYFKNKDTFVYNKKYSELLIDICKKYSFPYGTIEDTEYKIPTRLEEGTLFDICTSAAGFTLLEKGKNFVLYDDFGKITLRSLANMMLPLLIDSDVTGKWTLKESIDTDVYNRIIIKQDNSQTGERGLYIANDTDTQKKWGVLSYIEDGDEGSSAETLKDKANALLKFYNRPNKTFSVKNCLGHTEVRGGSLLIAYFDIGNGKKIQNLMIVNKVEHTFSDNYHFMDMNLYGGGYSE